MTDREENILISIIIPVYNVEKYIEKCLDSLADLDIENEIILINDGSTDKSLEKIEKYRESNPEKKILLFTQKNQGQAAARNKGIKNAKGRYISFIDSDDFVDIEKYNRFIKITIENNLDLSIGNFNYYYGENDSRNHIQFTRENLDSKKIDTGINWLLFFNECYTVEPWNKLYRRKFLMENGHFFKKGRVHEDVIFTTEVFLKAQKVKYFDICFYNYFQGNVSSTMKTIKEKNYDDMILNIKEIGEYKKKYSQNRNLEKFLNELIYHFFDEMMEKTYKMNNKIFKKIQKEYRNIFRDYKVSENMDKRLRRKSKKLCGNYFFIYYNEKLNKIIKKIKKGDYNGNS